MMDEPNIADLRERYVAYYGEEPAPPSAVACLESTLGIVLPNDMRQIAAFYSGGILGGISHDSFDSSDPATNAIVRNTMSLRSAIDLPHRFIVLAEPAESLIVLDVSSGVVIWCDNFDVNRLDDSSTMLGKPTTWPSYAEFFKHLLDEESEERAEVN